MTAPPDLETQRLDRWLWHARIFKTRALAARVVTDSGVRLTRHGQTQLVNKPGFAVRPSDQLTFARAGHVAIITVLGFAPRRGPASEAQTLYEDQSPPRPPKATAVPERVGPRPTKKDRRTLDRVTVETDE